MRTTVMCAAALGAVIASPALAGADDTVVLPVVAEPGTKARYVKRANASLEQSARSIEGAAMSPRDAGQLTGVAAMECTRAAECLVAAGTSLEAKRVIGVSMTAYGEDHALLFVLVDVESGQEIGRTEEVIRHRDLRTAPGERLAAFVEAHPAGAPAPASEPESEPESPGDISAAPPADDDDTGVPVDPSTEPEPVAEPTATPREPPVERDPAPPALHVGLQAGVFLPQVASELATTGAIKLEVGYRAWKNLSPFASASYAQPTVDVEQTDPRVGMYTTSTTQKELAVTLGALWRFARAGAPLNGYAGAGLRVWMLETVSNGEAGGMSFLENTETSTRIGGAALVGGELRLGPGAGVVELELGGSDLPHLITGDVATTAVTIGLGYRLLL